MTTTPTIAFEEIAPEQAAAWLEHNNLDNRPLRAAAVAAIVRDMEAGNYLVTGDSIKFDTNGRLMDGQHRLSAIAKHGRTVLAAVAKGLDPRVQVVIDAGSKRSGADALKFAGLEKYRTVVASMAKLDRALSLGGVRADSISVARGRSTNAEVTQWWEENPDAERAAADGSGLTHSIGATSKSAVSYALLRLRSIDEEAANEFFASIAEMRTNGAGDPRLALTRFLGELSGNKAVASMTLFGTFRAWNAWRSGESMTRIVSTTRTGVRTIPEPA